MVPDRHEEAHEENIILGTAEATDGGVDLLLAGVVPGADVVGTGGPAAAEVERYDAALSTTSAP
jgi:hypothetical protein